jgi:hypothetical protein
MPFLSRFNFQLANYQYPTHMHRKSYHKRVTAASLALSWQEIQMHQFNVVFIINGAAIK